jgi:hypothetical protein
MKTTMLCPALAACPAIFKVNAPAGREIDIRPANFTHA